MKYLTVLFIFMCHLTSYSQWSNDPTLNLVLSDTGATFSHLNPKSVSDGNGGAIIVWGQSSIYGQRVNSNGEILWNENGIQVGNVGDPIVLSFLINPVIISDDSGGAIIAWSEFNQKRIIGASRIRPDGTRIWSKRISYSPTGIRTNPSICTDGNSGAYIAWEDTRNGNSDIYVQHIDYKGTITWDTSGVAACLAIQNQTVPKVASDGMGGVFITWADNRILDSDIYAQLINSQGEHQYQQNGMPVCVMSNNPAGNPRIVNNNIGEAIIAWTDGRAGGTWDIYAQKVNQDTIGWLTEINGVSICNEVRSQWKCEMIADGLGGVIISWQDTRRISFNEEDVYMQKISSAGLPEWTLNGIPVCTQPGNPSVLHSLTSDGDAGAIISWQDERNGNTDLYVQKVQHGGNTLWEENGVAVSTAPFTQASVTVSNDGHGGAILAWHDARHGSYLYIYGQGVDSAGTLGGTTSVDEEFITKTFTLYQNYPNPFNPSTKISWQSPISSHQTIKIYDVLGNEVATLVDEFREAGRYEITFDANELSSGVYFYKLQVGSFVETKKMNLLR